MQNPKPEPLNAHGAQIVPSHFTNLLRRLLIKRKGYFQCCQQLDFKYLVLFTLNYLGYLIQ